MPFGIDTVTLVSFNETGVPSELGTYPLTEVTTDLPGCRHRPLPYKEQPEYQTNEATELWRTTIPIFEYGSSLSAAVLALKSNDVIRVSGTDYHVVGGVRPHKDEHGYFKVTIISQKQRG